MRFVTSRCSHDTAQSACTHAPRSCLCGVQDGEFVAPYTGVIRDTTVFNEAYESERTEAAYSFGIVEGWIADGVVR